MAMVPMRRNPLTSMLDFAAERNREAASLGSVISQIAKPALSGMGVQTDEMTPQPAVMTGPAPQAQPLGAFTGPALAPTLVDARETPGLQPRVTELLTGLESAYGQPLNVTSGYRSPERNAAVGGAKGSQHMHGNAVDIDVSGMSTDERRKLIELAQAQGFTGVGIYDNSLHFDTGAERAWGPSYRRDSVPSWAADLVGGAGSASMSGNAGTDTLGTGNNVEDILAQLYPQMSPEDERKQNRKDFFAAASQGLSALSQGRPQDFSNIRQAKEQRRTQAVQDMRERERARSAASLVYSQTGDAALATGIATGAISYNDVLTERQTRRANELADQQRIRDAESADAVATAMGRTGLYNEDDIAAVRDGRMTADQLGSVYEQGRLAEELRAEAEAKQELATQNVIDAQTVLQSAAPGSIEARAAERVIALGGNENVYDIIKARTPAAAEGFTLKPGETRFGPGGEQIAAIPAAPGADKAYQFQAEIEQRMRALNEDEATATRAVLDKAQSQGYALTFGADGKIASVTFGGTGAPAAGTVVDLAKPATGTATVVGPDGQLTEQPLVGATAPQQAAVDLAASRQKLEAEIAAASDNAARIAAEAKLAGVKAEQAQLEYDAAVANQAVDAESKRVELETLRANQKKAETEAATLVADAAKQQTAEYANATRSFAIFENAAKDVLRDADNAWTTGTYGNIAMALLPDNFATQRSSFLAAVKQMGSQAMLDALKEAKAAGVTLTPVSNLDVEALGASNSRLLAPQQLEGEAIRKEVVFQLNLAKDALLGPKDLTRVDEFGQPYKTDADTLGLTEDTFARHWREIPPAVAEAWRNGELDALPTDDPGYAEAADTLNQHINNWQTYQGDLDRATVGVLPSPPEGVDPEEWPDVWLELSVAERAAYRKQAKKGNQ